MRNTTDKARSKSTYTHKLFDTLICKYVSTNIHFIQNLG